MLMSEIQIKTQQGALYLYLPLLLHFFLLMSVCTSIKIRPTYQVGYLINSQEIKMMVWLGVVGGEGVGGGRGAVARKHLKIGVQDAVILCL